MLATNCSSAPSCQLSPVTVNMADAATAPVHANPASRCLFLAVRSARAPTTGSSRADSSVEAVTT